MQPDRVWVRTCSNVPASLRREAGDTHVSSSLWEHREGSEAELQRVCRLTSQDVPGCGRNAVESTGLTGLGIQPASSALRGCHQAAGECCFAGGSTTPAQKTQIFKVKTNPLILHRHLLHAPKKSGVCTMVLHIPFTLLSLSTKPRHLIFIPHIRMELRPEPLATINVLNLKKIFSSTVWSLTLQIAEHLWESGFKRVIINSAVEQALGTWDAAGQCSSADVGHCVGL